MQRDILQIERTDERKRKGGTDAIVAIVVFIISVAAFITALGYDPISARTPLICLIPLIILSFIQVIRSVKISGFKYIGMFFKDLFEGQNHEYKKITEITLWTIALSLFIFVAGQYVGMAIFLVMLLRFISKEKWLLISITTIVMVVVFYFLFEHIFEVQLYRGLIYRIWRGFDIF